MLLFLVVPLVFLLPGYAWIRFSELTQRFGVLETIVLSFILSVSFTSLSTAGLSFATPHYLSYSVTTSLVVSLILLILSLRYREWTRSSEPPRFNRALFPVFVLSFLYAVIFVALFWSSPFYPTTDAFDPIIHAQIVQAINSGLARTTLLHSNFAIGMHFVAAVLERLTGVNSITAIRLLLSMVIVVSLFLAFFCARSVLGADYANFAVIAWALIVPADAIHLVKVGTFPNVLSDALVIATLWLISSYTKEPNYKLGLTLTFLTVMGVFVHSTFLIFLAALWLALPVFYFCHKLLFRNYLKSLLFSTLGLFGLLIVLGSFMSATFARIFAGYVITSFSSIPIVLNLELLVYNYSALTGPLAALAVFAAVAFTVAKRRSLIWSLLLCVWFGVLMVGAIISLQGWRFILLSMIPGGLLLGASIGSVRELNSASVNWPKARHILVSVLVCVLILSGGFIGLLPRAFDPSSRAREEAIVDSMLWLKQHDQGQGVASVGLLSDYRYLTTLTGITYAGDFNESANSMLTESRTRHFSYTAVAVQTPQFPTFRSNILFEERYQNSVVAIFELFT